MTGVDEDPRPPRPTRWPRLGPAERALWLLTALLALGSPGVQRLWRAKDEQVWVTAEACGSGGLDPWSMVTIDTWQGRPWSELHTLRAQVAARNVEDLRARPGEDAATSAERWEAIRQAELMNAEALRGALLAPGERFEYSMGRNRRNELGAGDDVRLVRGASRFYLYLDAPALALTLAGVLGTALALARWAPRAGSTDGEVLASFAVSAATLVLHLGGRLAWKAFAPASTASVVPSAVVLALEGAGFAPRLVSVEAAAASSLLLVVFVVVALARLEQARSARAPDAGLAASP